MTQLRISEAAALLGVSDDTVRRWADQGRLSLSQDASGRQVVAGAQLASLAQEVAGNTDALDPAAGHRSARNHFTGLVTKVTSDAVMSQVELQCGPFRVVSLISTEAVRELGLEVGSLATAVVKATNVTVEAFR
ncbi:MAG: TOBE domain-containing protein [Micropruina sp.]|uniref:TOBE domain-containing protein n=1 Tax=Micropruina sp. TaxID=2737536 RepID=UPI0039E35751